MLFQLGFMDEVFTNQHILHHDQPCYKQVKLIFSLVSFEQGVISIYTVEKHLYLVDDWLQRIFILPLTKSIICIYANKEKNEFGVVKRKMRPLEKLCL